MLVSDGLPLVEALWHATKRIPDFETTLSTDLYGQRSFVLFSSSMFAHIEHSTTTS